MDIKAAYKQITIQAIQSINSNKLADNIAPIHATSVELKHYISVLVDKIVNEMVNDGEIKRIETMNDKAYEVLNNQLK